MSQVALSDQGSAPEDERGFSVRAPAFVYKAVKAFLRLLCFAYFRVKVERRGQDSRVGSGDRCPEPPQLHRLPRRRHHGHAPQSLLHGEGRSVEVADPRNPARDLRCLPREPGRGRPPCARPRSGGAREGGIADPVPGGHAPLRTEDRGIARGRRLPRCAHRQLRLCRWASAGRRPQCPRGRACRTLSR